MRIAYFDCTSGISGDMTLGALLDAGADLAAIKHAVASMDLGEVSVATQTVLKHGFRATQVHIQHPQQHHHRHLADINALLNMAQMDPEARRLAIEIFHNLGQAEASVHGCGIHEVHFHEVGAIDSIIDIVGTAIALTGLEIGRIEASPITTGCGTVKIAHGTVGIPAPATSLLLRGIPVIGSQIAAELTTPTGAAILKTICQRFGPLPAMTVQALGWGAGTMDLPQQANVLRVFIGTDSNEAPLMHDHVTIIETNLDDCTAEEIAWCVQEIFDAGALDVFQSPAMMKKSRLGTRITVLSPNEIANEIETLLLERSSAIGVRTWSARRTKLLRQVHQVQTEFGPIEGKAVWLPSGQWRFKAEHDCLAKAAREHRLSLKQITDAAQQAFDPNKLAPPSESKSNR